VHTPGKKKIVGTRPYEVNGVIMYRDITAQEIHVAGPGEVVELPLTEITRLTELGFLTPIDDGQPAKAKPIRPTSPTGIENDPRLTGKPMNSLSTASTR
jgi:hypothetical protein